MKAKSGKCAIWRQMMIDMLTLKIMMMMAMISRHGKSVKDCTDGNFSLQKQHRKRVFRDTFEFASKQYKFNVGMYSFILCTHHIIKKCQLLAQHLQHNAISTVIEAQCLQHSSCRSVLAISTVRAVSIAIVAQYYEHSAISKVLLAQYWQHRFIDTVV